MCGCIQSCVNITASYWLLISRVWLEVDRPFFGLSGYLNQYGVLMHAVCDVGRVCWLGGGGYSGNWSTPTQSEDVRAWAPPPLPCPSPEVVSPTLRTLLLLHSASPGWSCSSSPINGCRREWCSQGQGVCAPLNQMARNGEKMRKRNGTWNRRHCDPFYTLSLIHMSLLIHISSNKYDQQPPPPHVCPTIRLWP